MPCPNVATMTRTTGTHTLAAVLRLPVALIAAALLTLAFAVPASASTSAVSRTVEERIEVPAGPGQDGVIALDTTLYLPPAGTSTFSSTVRDPVAAAAGAAPTSASRPAASTATVSRARDAPARAAVEGDMLATVGQPTDSSACGPQPPLSALSPGAFGHPETPRTGVDVADP